jgi:hypothetical protein
MVGIDFEKSVVALACWRALRSEQYRGMSFGAMALRNRAILNGTQIYDEALEYLYDSRDFPDAREPQFQALLAVMDGIFNNTVMDKTDGATHWGWNECTPGTRTCQAGQVIFYKETP